MKSIIHELLQQKNTPKVSIVISTDIRSFDARDKFRLKLKNQIKQAANRLMKACEEETARKMIHSMKEMAQNIHPSHWEGGIGLYVSPGYKKQVLFPFKVHDKLIVGDTFDISDLEKTLEKMVEFVVLLLSKNQTRLMKGKGNKLKEINNKYFPMQFDNEFQVHRTAPGSFYNEEESEIDQARLKTWFRKVDNHLSESTHERPLILVGVVKHLSTFKQISKNTKNILAEMHGNYDHASIHEIRQKLLPLMEDYLNNKAIGG